VKSLPPKADRNQKAKILKVEIHQNAIHQTSIKVIIKNIILTIKTKSIIKKAILTTITKAIIKKAN
jgi:hypothetical protein